MKRDGRTLVHATLETIRLMAVERVLEGEVVSAVITSYGFNRTTIYKWLTAAAKPGVGLRALQARPAPGRPRRLTPGQERQVFHWINGKDPRHAAKLRMCVSLLYTSLRRRRIRPRPASAAPKIGRLAGAGTGLE